MTSTDSLKGLSPFDFPVRFALVYNLLHQKTKTR